jgi:membrane-bound serine protease (ClpP class)
VVPLRLHIYVLTIVAAFVAWVWPQAAAQSQDTAHKRGHGSVVVIDVRGAVGVGTSYFIQQSLAEAKQRDARLLILQLDTPGGLVSATREIIQGILSSPIPVAVYVAPSGARAASAGTYISYAAHFAAMAPGTHLGAATPIQMGTPGTPSPLPSPSEKEKSKPGEGSAMDRKVVNDAVSYLRSLAELRGRNADWAEKAVREAATLTSSEALKERVVEVVATDVGHLLEQLDGRTYRAVDGEQKLAVRHALVVPIEAGWRTRFLTAITDPNVAFILLMIGVYGIIFEFWSPGLTGPGVVGGVALIVALAALSALPISYAGMALLALGLALMIAEALAPGFGILGLGGTIAFALGAIFLFDPAGADIDFAIAWPVVISATLTSALLLVGLLSYLMKSRSAKVVTGSEEMIGLVGRVVSWTADPSGRGEGRVSVHGETWSARATTPLAAGQSVTVVERNGLVLTVAPINQRS